MIFDLDTLTGQHWYMIEIVDAHEDVHYQEAQSSYNPQFGPMKTTIENLTVDFTCGSTAQSARDVFTHMPALGDALIAGYSSAMDAYELIPDPNDTIHAAEHAVADPMVAAIRAKATQQQWPACQ